MNYTRTLLMPRSDGRVVWRIDWPSGGSLVGHADSWDDAIRLVDRELRGAAPSTRGEAAPRKRAPARHEPSSGPARLFDP